MCLPCGGVRLLYGIVHLMGLLQIKEKHGNVEQFLFLWHFSHVPWIIFDVAFLNSSVEHADCVAIRSCVNNVALEKAALGKIMELKHACWIFELQQYNLVMLTNKKIQLATTTMVYSIFFTLTGNESYRKHCTRWFWWDTWLAAPARHCATHQIHWHSCPISSSC